MYLLRYLSEINLSGWGKWENYEHEAPTPRIFFYGAFETFDIAHFFCVKIALASKIMYLDAYTIFFYTLSYARSVNGNNQDAEGTGTIT